MPKKPEKHLEGFGRMWPFKRKRKQVVATVRFRIEAKKPCLSNSERIKIAFVGGHTRRWHAEDIIGEERVDSHTWGMLAMIHILHPSPSIALLGAITFHDSPGEPFSGDIPYGAKRAFPSLKQADQEIGERVARATGTHYEITAEEQWWLSLVDLGQAYLFLRRQVAQGNCLLDNKIGECAYQLKLMVTATNAPANAEAIVEDIRNCDTGSSMSRDLSRLEEQAR